MQSKITNLPPKLEYFLNSAKVTIISLAVTLGAVVVVGFLINGLSLPLSIYSNLIANPTLIGAFILCFLIYIKMFVKLWQQTFKVISTVSDIISPLVFIMIFSFVVFQIV